MNDELKNAISEELEKESRARFEKARQYLLEKNRELYRRLALYDTYGPEYKSTLAYLDNKPKAKD